MHREKDELNAAIGKSYYANMCRKKESTKKCHHQASGKTKKFLIRSGPPSHHNTPHI